MLCEPVEGAFLSFSYAGSSLDEDAMQRTAKMDGL